MIKLDRTYSDYTELDDPNYPNGKAVDCSTDESYDGTPILKELVNDLHGALEAVVKESAGSISGVSGNPDNINASDFKDAIMDLIETPDEAHAALRGTDAHGATVEATPGQLMTRDANGRAQVANPSADADIANKGFLVGITGVLSDLATSVKTNIVAAINSHVNRTDNPHSVTKSQVGLGNCDNTADSNKSVSKAATLTTARTIDGVSFNGGSAIIHYGKCSTAAGTKEKTVICNGFSLVDGARISVLFTNGNTYGNAKTNSSSTSSNVMAVASAPTLNVSNGSAYTGARTIYVGGEPVGEGFIKPGEVHDFVYEYVSATDGKWHDVTADVIYKGGDSTNGYYEKKRNGLIEQFITNNVSSGTSKSITLPIKMSNRNYSITSSVDNTESFTIFIIYVNLDSESQITIRGKYSTNNSSAIYQDTIPKNRLSIKGY